MDRHRFEQGPIQGASALNQGGCQPLEASQGIGGLPIGEPSHRYGPRQAKPQTDGPAMDDALAEIGPTQGFQLTPPSPIPAMEKLNRPDAAELHLGLGAIEPPGQGGYIQAKTRSRDQFELGAGSIDYLLAGNQQHLGRHNRQGKGPAAPPRRSQGASPTCCCLRLHQCDALR